MQKNKKLGDILIEQNILCTKVVERVVAISKKLNKRFGTVLEEMGLVTDVELVHGLAMQYNLKPLFGFSKASFPPEVLGLISATVALENTLFPLKCDANRLALALADPTQTKIIANIAANNNLVVVPYISTAMEINKAIGKHYFGKDIAAPAKNTILIVEDDTTVLTVLRDTLSKHYRVITAVDGLDAYKEVISKKTARDLDRQGNAETRWFRLVECAESRAGDQTNPHYTHFRDHKCGGGGPGVRERFFRFHSEAGKGNYPSYQG